MRKIAFFPVLGLLFFNIFINAQTASIGADRIAYQDAILEEKFEYFEVYQIHSESLVKLVKEEADVHSFTLNILNEELHFEIYPSHLLSPDYILQSPGGDRIHTERSNYHRAFRGSLTNDTGGEVSLTIDNGFIYGYFEWNRGIFFIEPVSLFSPDVSGLEDAFVIYEKGDVRPVQGVRCGSEDLDENQHYLDERPETNGTRRAGQCYILELAIASDFSMFNHYGGVSSVENRNIGVINNVQTNYIGQFDDDIEFLIVTQWISDCSTCDPWTSNDDPNILLPDFRSWGNGGGFGVPFDMGELWSRRDFGGSDDPTIGLAYLNAICNNRRYHILQDFTSSAPLLRVLVAHEMGHNFSASHDAPNSGFIMAPSVSNTNDWSPASQNDMSAYIVDRANTGSCFDMCAPPEPPIPDFAVLNTIVCEGGTVYFYDKSLPAADSWNWSFPGGQPNFSSVQNPVVTYNTPGTYDITLEVGNGAGSNLNIFDGVVTVTSAGQDIVLYEDFDNGINWQLVNPDGQATWEAIPAGGTVSGTGTARVDNFNYQAQGQRDGLISPPFSMLGRLNGMLTIEYAYARFDQNFTDSMIVYLSQDGGQSFPIRLFQGGENGSGNFATHPQQTNPFAPTTETDWCFASSFGPGCVEVDMTAYAGEDNLAIMIENYNGFGNNLYVDRVYVSAACFTVEPPVADFSADPITGCLPLFVDFFDLSTGDPDSWSWTFEGGDPEFSNEQHPSVFYLNPGQYSVTLEVSNAGGTDILILDQYIEVTDIPVAGFDVQVNGNQVTFFNTTTGADEYLWNFGDGMTSELENPVHTYLADGTYFVTLTAENDCGEDVATDSVVIAVQVMAAFTVDTLSGCVPLTVQFTDQSSDNVTAWNWSFEGGNPANSNLQNPTIVYDSAGTYDVMLVVSNAFTSDTAFMNDMISVQSAPVAQFSDSLVSNIIYLTDMSLYADSLLWDFGDGSTSNVANPVHTYGVDGNYTVTLVAFNECGQDTASIQINVSFLPFAVISADVESGCEPLTVNFSDSNSVNADSVEWTFEGGTPGSSNEPEPMVLYEMPGSFTVSLIVYNPDGSDTAVWNEGITVLPLPVAGYSYQQDGTILNFTNQSQNADQYEWIFGDGESGSESDPSHDYGMDGTYIVLLIASNTCGADSLEMQITIGNPPLAGFSSDHVEICRGETILFSNNSSPNTTSFSWVFQGGNPSMSTDANPVVTYSNAGTYDVSLTATNNFGTHTVSMTDYITVLPDPLADFDFTINGQEVTFENQSLNYDRIEWDFGDSNGSELENPVHTYAVEDLYEVILTVYGECDTVELTRTVNTTTMPLADFDSDLTMGCAPFTVQFMDESSGIIDNRMWSFPGGDPSSSTEQNPVVTYHNAGIYEVTLMVSNSSGSNNNTKDEYIEVGDVPSAGFSVDQDGGTVAFTNQTSDAHSYRWFFGNDSTSTEVNPVAIYDLTGQYEVILVATNDCGNDTSLMEITVILDDIEDIHKSDALRLYPNPASQYLVLELGDSIQGEVSWRIIDLTGRTVLTGDTHKQAGEQRELISLRSLQQAAFFMEVTSKQKRYQSKFFVK